MGRPGQDRVAWIRGATWSPRSFAEQIAAGVDVRPTIAITKAHINMPELKDAVTAGRLKPDGDILSDNGDVRVTKAAIDPVWYLPGHREPLRREGDRACGARSSSRPRACSRSS